MFEDDINRFARNLNNLRGFLALLKPYLEQHSLDVATGNIRDFAPIFYAVRKSDPDPEKPFNITEQDVMSIFGGDIQLKEIEDTEGKKSIELTTNNLRDARRLESVTNLVTEALEHRRTLDIGSLITLTSLVEWFMSQMLHRYYQNYPDAVGSHEQRFSIADLESFESIEDARESLIQSRVTDIMRGSLEEWFSFMKKDLKLSMSYTDIHKDNLVELFQRRNLLVHNGGRVNSIYLRNVAPRLKENLSVGDTISFNEDYVEAAIDTVELNFILIAAEFWKQLDGTDENRADTLNKIAYQRLKSERWIVSEGLSRFLMKDSQMPELNRLMGSVNYWQSMKWQGRFDEIADEVTELDVTAKEPIFRLCKSALLDDTGTFFNLLPIALAGEKFDHSDLVEWPLFREMRDTPEYQSFYEANRDDFPSEDSESTNVVPVIKDDEDKT